MFHSMMLFKGANRSGEDVQKKVKMSGTANGVRPTLQPYASMVSAALTT